MDALLQGQMDIQTNQTDGHGRTVTGADGHTDKPDRRSGTQFQGQMDIQTNQIDGLSEGLRHVLFHYILHSLPVGEGVARVHLDLCADGGRGLEGLCNTRTQIRSLHMRMYTGVPPYTAIRHSTSS